MRRKNSILSLSKDESPQLRSALLAWHRRNALRAPWRETGDPYHVLVAAVMAQQTQMSRVLLKFDEFISAFPTIERLAGARTARVLRVWEGMGYNLRALRLHRAAKLIVRMGGFPRTATELEQIEGIGPFTAAIISSFAFREPAAAVDTNVRRVIARLSGDVDVTLTDRDVQPAADVLISRRAPARWNQAIMDLGGRVCVSRSPKCDVCPIARWCRSRAAFDKSPRKVAERRASYKPQPKFEGSRRYHRGRIVQALRELPEGRSLSPQQLGNKLGIDNIAELLDVLERDGLIRRLPIGRVRLP
ncbi:MAG: A/G-specific adenine glycosylase [Chloroflexi bacterium]|nr:A/G-specific adenine glycosylase [Chloroflexota bacterium]